MSFLRTLFFPKKRDFFKMLKDQAVKTEEGIQGLVTFVDNPTEENGKRVYDIEKEADEIRRNLVMELNDSFITPIDREDIYTLSRAIDDMVDYAKTSVEELRLFKVVPNQFIKDIAGALHNASKEITQAIDLMRKNPTEAQKHLVTAKKAENYVEHRYREALAQLFETTDMIHVLKMREVYRHLSNAADRGDEAADIIGDIIIKIT